MHTVATSGTEVCPVDRCPNWQWFKLVVFYTEVPSKSCCTFGREHFEVFYRAAKPHGADNRN